MNNVEEKCDRQAKRLKTKRKEKSAHKSKRLKQQKREKQPISGFPELALASYDEKNGTDFELVEVLKMAAATRPRRINDGTPSHAYWCHFNFKVKLRNNADPTNPSPNLFFAEATFQCSNVTLRPILEPNDPDGCHAGGLGRPYTPSPVHSKPCNQVEGECSNTNELSISNVKEKCDHQAKRLKAKSKEKSAHKSKQLKLKRGAEGATQCSKQEEIRQQKRAKQSEFPELALASYNEKNGTDFEFVKVLKSRGAIRPGRLDDGTTRHAFWSHINFMAKLRNDADCSNSSPKLFFAEVVPYPTFEFINVTQCSILEPNDPGNTNTCSICNPAENILHPADGFRVGLGMPYTLPCHFQPAPSNKISFIDCLRY